MKRAIIIHGMPSKEEYFDPKSVAPSHNHWFSWLQRQLLLNEVLTQTPEMPEPYSAKYEDWRDILNRFHPDEKTILVGHSLGGGFLVRWLSEANAKVGKVVLVAPWLDPNKELETDFFNFLIDPQLVSKTESTAIFISDDDDKEELDSTERLKSEVENILVKEFKGKGHFILAHMGTEEFPELRDFLLDK